MVEIEFDFIKFDDALFSIYSFSPNLSLREPAPLEENRDHITIIPTYMGNMYILFENKCLGEKSHKVLWFSEHSCNGILISQMSSSETFSIFFSRLTRECKRRLAASIKMKIYSCVNIRLQNSYLA